MSNSIITVFAGKDVVKGNMTTERLSNQIKKQLKKANVTVRCLLSDTPGVRFSSTCISS